MRPELTKIPDIILVEDHMIFRQGIKAIINFENIGNVIGEVSNGKDFLDLISVCKPDLVLMDIEMSEMNGIELTKIALESYPELKIIAFTGYADEEYCCKMYEIGAMGYILKTGGLKELEAAILKVMHGDKYFSHELDKAGIKIVEQPDEVNEAFENEINLHLNSRKMLFFPWLSR
jgi:DNA-binding NarL/FixJ family response regulator